MKFIPKTYASFIKRASYKFTIFHFLLKTDLATICEMKLSRIIPLSNAFFKFQ